MFPSDKVRKSKMNFSLWISEGLLLKLDQNHVRPEATWLQHRCRWGRTRATSLRSMKTKIRKKKRKDYDFDPPKDSFYIFYNSRRCFSFYVFLGNCKDCYYLDTSRKLNTLCRNYCSRMYNTRKTYELSLLRFFRKSLVQVIIRIQ